MTSGQYENNLTKHNVSLPVITHCTDILWQCPVDILRGTTKKTMHIWCTPSLSNTKTHKIYGHTVCFGLNKDKGTLCFAVLKPLKTQNYTHRDQRAYKQKITKHIRILTLTHTLNRVTRCWEDCKERGMQAMWWMRWQIEDSREGWGLPILWYSVV